MVRKRVGGVGTRDASLLFGVEARNPTVIASVVGVVGTMGVLACVLAARGNLPRALRDAFAQAANPQGGAEPLDWLETTCPRRWRLRGQPVQFDWSAPEGPWPFKD
jgi:hypothetical protein